MAICEQRARGRGVSRLRLEVNHHNELARRLYRPAATSTIRAIC
ncbi:hypothetical protein ACE0DR_26135 [Azotobacter sp. CWF10]